MMHGQVVYVVQGIGWEYDDEYFEPVTDSPVKAFTNREDAEAHRRVLEEEARRQWDAETAALHFRCVSTIFRESNRSRRRKSGTTKPPEESPQAVVWHYRVVTSTTSCAARVRRPAVMGRDVLPAFVHDCAV
jgi:hypothetical protein